MLLADVCLLCEAPAGGVPNLCDACAAELAALARPAPASPRVRLRAAFRYAPPASTLVQAFKYRGDLPAGLTLATLLAHHLAEQPPAPPQALIPVPLHPSRLRARGFNQAVELAARLGRLMDVPVMADACRRARATAPQSELDSARARFANVTGAFVMATELSGISHVAVVDDVVTTGATVRELGRVLRRAGVRRVDVWSCARAG